VVPKAACCLRRGGQIVFYIKIKISTVAIYCACITRKIELPHLVADGERKEINYSVSEAHERLGHALYRVGN
jgi:hypothetical protein